MADRFVSTLSGGERQRVIIARALAQAAPVLLLDEPTTALDVGHQQDVLELVDQLRVANNLTVLSTMHDLAVAGQYADRMALLDGGRVVVSGPGRASADRGADRQPLSRPGPGAARGRAARGGAGAMTSAPDERPAVDEPPGVAARKGIDY